MSLRQRQRKIKRPSQPQLIELPPVTMDCFEKALRKEGFLHVAGVDEAGRGCLAGPVVAAAAILPVDFCPKDLTDSKKLSQKQREDFFEVISKEAVSVGVGIVQSEEIDAINILNASLKAMSIAVGNLQVVSDYLLIDGPFSINVNVRQRAIVKGDGLSVSVAAASIIAKVTRDRLMDEFESKYPLFHFSVHKGYGTKLHLSELAQSGPTPIHRVSYKGVEPKEKKSIPLFPSLDGRVTKRSNNLW